MKNPESYFHPDINGSVGVHPDAAMASPGFFFNRKTEKIDWRQIAAVDIERITRDMDYRALQDNITNIAFCDIERELDSRYIDPNFIRLFKLAQLQIQYLLYSQEYLTESLSREAERNQSFDEEMPRLRSQVDALKKECHRYKKMIRIQQMLMPSSHDLHHPCPQCDKKFISRDFLVSHLERRHRAPAMNTSTGSSARAEVDELRLKIRALELELQSQQKEPSSAPDPNRLDAEMTAYKKELSAQSQNEISALKSMIRDLTERSLNSEKALDELRVKQNQGHRSNLGEIEDEEAAFKHQQAKLEMAEENRKLQAELAREKALSKKMAERQRTAEQSRPAEVRKKEQNRGGAETKPEHKPELVRERERASEPDRESDREQVTPEKAAPAASQLPLDVSSISKVCEASTPLFERSQHVTCPENWKKLLVKDSPLKAFPTPPKMEDFTDKSLTPHAKSVGRENLLKATLLKSFSTPTKSERSPGMASCDRSLLTWPAKGSPSKRFPSVPPSVHSGRSGDGSTPDQSDQVVSWSAKNSPSTKLSSTPSQTLNSDSHSTPGNSDATKGTYPPDRILPPSDRSDLAFGTEESAKMFPRPPSQVSWKSESPAADHPDRPASKHQNTVSPSLKPPPRTPSQASGKSESHSDRGLLTWGSMKTSSPKRWLNTPSQASVKSESVEFYEVFVQKPPSGSPAEAPSRTITPKTATPKNVPQAEHVIVELTPPSVKFATPPKVHRGGSQHGRFKAGSKKSQVGAGDSELVPRRAASSHAQRSHNDVVPFQEPPSTPHTPHTPHTPQSPPKKEEMALHLKDSNELTEYTDEEEEEEEDDMSDSAMVSREMKKTLAASGPLGGTGDYSVQSSWDISQLRSSRVMEKLKAEPELLQGFISELQKLLEERLVELGIDRHAKRITTPVLNEKLGILRREREQMCAKHAQFAAIRQQFVRQVDREAEEQLRGRRKDDRAAKSRSLPSATTYSTTPVAQRKSSNSRRPPPRSPPPDLRADRGSDLRPQPPPPRDLSSYSTSEETETESESPPARPAPPSRSTSAPEADVRPSPRKPRQYKGLSASNGVVKADLDSPLDSPPGWDTTDGRKLGLGTSGAPVVTIPQSEAAEDVDEGSWDASDTDQLEEDLARHGAGVQYQKEALQRSLGASRGQRPPGGVDVAPPPPPQPPAIRGTGLTIDDEDDTFSISSINGEGSRPPSRKVSSDGGERGLFGGGLRVSGSVGSSGNGYGGGAGGMRMSAAATDLSNTFGTSQWGTTSKVVSTVNPGATQKSMATNKSSDVGGDDDFDFD